ncbi:MAG: heterodisulfide reductase subunit [Clostridia bacterium]|jgi:heterodisulfide reductase subunit C|nr:heterodisulfide reductase subunit [Clostridia bacterium]MDN5322658.1 heterodisulfide reductase subunit [Clostridia bacterium]
MYKDFTDEIMSYPGGEKIMACMQCGTCTGSCPTSHAMQYTPRRLISLIRANQRETVLKSLDIWKCASCYTCTARCPRGIKFTDIMYILKTLAWKDQLMEENKDITAFYSAFQDLIAKRGRMNESELVLKYSLKTNPAKLLEFGPLGMKMVLKGRAAIIPPSIRNQKQVQKILELAKERGGE